MARPIVTPRVGAAPARTRLLPDAGVPSARVRRRSFLPHWALPFLTAVLVPDRRELRRGCRDRLFRHTRRRADRHTHRRGRTIANWNQFGQKSNICRVYRRASGHRLCCGSDPDQEPWGPVHRWVRGPRPSSER